MNRQNNKFSMKTRKSREHTRNTRNKQNSAKQQNNVQCRQRRTQNIHIGKHRNRTTKETPTEEYRKKTEPKGDKQKQEHEETATKETNQAIPTHNITWIAKMACLIGQRIQ